MPGSRPTAPRPQPPSTSCATPTTAVEAQLALMEASYAGAAATYSEIAAAIGAHEKSLTGLGKRVAAVEGSASSLRVPTVGSLPSVSSGTVYVTRPATNACTTALRDSPADSARLSFRATGDGLAAPADAGRRRRAAGDRCLGAGLGHDRGPRAGPLPVPAHGRPRGPQRPGRRSRLRAGPPLACTTPWPRRSGHGAGRAVRSTRASSATSNGSATAGPEPAGPRAPDGRGDPAVARAAAFPDGRWLRRDPRSRSVAIAAPVDLGGIGKGLALRWAFAVLGAAVPGLEDGVAGALLEAGGDLVARGPAPQPGPLADRDREPPGRTRRSPSWSWPAAPSAPRRSASTPGRRTTGGPSTTCSTRAPASPAAAAWSP